MRVSPVGWLFNDLETVRTEARKSAAITHDHPEGIKGAEAIAAAIFLLRQGAEKEDIRKYVQETFGYNLRRTVEEIRPDYRFDVSCQGSVPESIIAFLDSKDLVDAIRLAISLGGGYGYPGRHGCFPGRTLLRRGTSRPGRGNACLPPQ
jgi:ADP-ribosyl-[dinitrogen reductase] hydrolase